MPKATTEMFGNFIYSPELSYNDLLVLEANLKDDISEVLCKNDAKHLHYDVSSDSFQVQCAFGKHDERFFHKICDQVVPFLQQDIEGKLVFINRDISVIHIYTIFGGDWRESCICIPHNSNFEEILQREES